MDTWQQPRRPRDWPQDRKEGRVPRPLVKHPDETDTYAIDHTPNLAEGEVLGQAVAMLPLLFGLAAPAGAVSLAITRVDAAPMGAGDLTASGLTALGGQVLFVLSGGNDGVTYQLQDEVASSTGAVKVGQGRLLVTSSLPQP